MARSADSPTRRAAIQTVTSVYAFLGSCLQHAELLKQAELLLSSEDLLQVVGEIPPGRGDDLIVKLNQVYLNADVQDKHFLDLLGTFYSTINQLPASVSLSAGLEKSSANPVDSEGLSDIWQGRYRGADVAIKVFRASSAHDLELAEKMLLARVPTWKKLNHPNIVVFHGLTTELFPLALVYNWEENGNILRYLKSHSQPPRLVLLLQIARGLQYLHSLDIAHGNLRGMNVLVDRSGQIRLTGYGLAPLYANPGLTAALPTTGDVRCLAPEIHCATDGVPVSKPADVFAFGVLGIEVFTGESPFGESNDIEIIRLVSGGKRPELPENAEAVGLTDPVWVLLQKCWDQDPTRRPTMDEVVGICEGLLGIDRVPPTIPTLEATETHQGTRRPRRQRRWSCGLW